MLIDIQSYFDFRFDVIGGNMNMDVAPMGLITWRVFTRAKFQPGPRIKSY
jgi:hypothetical protein